MTALPPLPAQADLYLQPTGWCGPGDDAVQIAGLPLWANAMRVIARDCGERVVDIVVPVRTLEQSTESDTLVDLFKAVTRARPVWELGRETLRLDQPRLMGIVNATPDSFSDGGDHFEPQAAVAAGLNMAKDGADILDIGGESTRPGAKTVWEGDELERVLPVLLGLKNSGSILSIDTRKAAVMRQAVEAGANIINDVSALTYDEDSLTAASKSAAPVILMHSAGDPQVMQKDPRYQDVVLDIYDALKDRISACVAAGIDRRRIAVDPGIGFGKTLRHNLSLLNSLSIFHGLGCPLLVGVSRKRFIGALADVETPKDRLPGSLAAALHALEQGVHILRVHDVAETRQALDVWRGLRDERQMPPAID